LSKIVSFPQVSFSQVLQYFFPLTPSFFRAASEKKLEGTLFASYIYQRWRDFRQCMFHIIEKRE